MTNPSLRWMIRRDLLAVLDIERRSYLNPMKAEQVMAFMEAQDITCQVLEFHDETIAGHVFYQSLATSLELHRFVIHPSLRQIGLGKHMLDVLKRGLSGKRPAIGVTVAESNIVAQLFLRANGFVCRSTIKGDEMDYYRFSYVSPLVFPSEVNVMVAE